MAPQSPPSNDRMDDQLSLTPSGREVPTAVSMMVDSMTNMVQRAKQDLELFDERARADVERLDQRARKDVERLDQRARKDVERLDQRARADHERLKRD